MDAHFFSRKSFVSALIASLSLTDDARCDPYPFSSRLSMTDATSLKRFQKISSDIRFESESDFHIKIKY